MTACIYTDTGSGVSLFPSFRAKVHVYLNGWNNECRPQYVFAVLWSQQAAAADNLPPLKTVQRVELDRYMRTWYEIASFPQRFEKGCVASMAIHSLRADGKVNVLNQCRNETLDGKLRTAQAILQRLKAQRYDFNRLKRTLPPQES